MVYAVDAVVVGAGVVGLACARKFAMEGKETIVLEKELSFGTGISSRNSEVIHAGIYYRPGSLKAALCLKGRDQLYDFCDSHQVSYQKVGKLIVAVDQEQAQQLVNIKQRAAANGCHEIHYLATHSIKTLEPELNAVEVLFSPKTGIIDSHALMMGLLGDFEASNGHLIFSSEISFIEFKKGYYEIGLNDAEKSLLQTKILVNAAGLDAINVSKRIDGLLPLHIPEFSLAKGSYFTYAGRSPFSHLIYPIPERGGLGIHLTLDLQGQARFGPDVEWVEHVNYTVDSDKADDFHRAISKYWPNCDRQRLIPGYAGIRPKIGNHVDFNDDFLIQTEMHHGLEGLANLFGIESPGLTSCMAIADYVFETLIKKEN